MVIFEPVHVEPPTTMGLLRAEMFGIWEPHEFRSLYGAEEAKPIHDALKTAARRLGLEDFETEVTSSMRGGLNVTIHTLYSDETEWPVMTWERFHKVYPDSSVIWKTMDRQAEHQRRKEAQAEAKMAKWHAEWEAQRNRKA